MKTPIAVQRLLNQRFLKFNRGKASSNRNTAYSKARVHHIAGNNQKIISIVFTGNEIEDYEKLIKLSGMEEAKKTIKRLVHEFIN